MTDSDRDRYDGTSEKMAQAFDALAAKEVDGNKMMAYPTAGSLRLSKLVLTPMKNVVNGSGQP